MRKSIVPAALLLTVFLLPVKAPAHCEVPCGIYGDVTRMDLMEEHVTTIERSIQMIQQLSAESSVNHNQLIRWVGNKDDHAVKLQEIVWQYFMAQRIKPKAPTDGKAYQEYVQQLTLLHRIQAHAMKAKQGTDLKQVETLRKLIKEFRILYLGEEE